ncbi:MAG: hypothetical protein WA446_10665 [Steroidobacteraceae bacterium]
MEDAKAKRTIRERAWVEGKNDDKAAGLEREFEASIQAIMAAAVAIDAFYSLLQPHIALPPDLVTRWRAGRTARYSQVAEVLRRAFHLKPKGAAALRRNLKGIYGLRDLAVHPSGKLTAPIMHPEIDVGVEWRFAYVRAHNAEVVVNAATWILWDLAHNGKPKDTKMQEYVGLLRQRLKELFPTGHPNLAAQGGSSL